MRIMIDIENKTEITVDEKLLNNIANTLTNKEIELILTTNDEIKSINKEHRNIDKSTDVLSFPYEAIPMGPLGSIMMSEDHITEKAFEYGHSNMDEIALLFIHGLLHLVGYDHEVDNGEMRKKERTLIEKFNLPISLIVRTQG